MGRMEDLDVVECERCDELCESRRRIVNGVGPDDADVLFVGEAPGEQEDADGEPFVGRSGEVLDEQLRIAGLDRETVRITNCVRCRPPDNRDPSSEELEHCREYLSREIDLIDPAVIVTLGKVPAVHLLDRPVAVTKEVGSVENVRIDDTPRRVLLCVHPAATLYDRSQEEPFAAAIEKAADIVGSTDGGGQARLGDF
ncbi:MAG: uracil-DNA glycosylase family 4 [Halobacteriales archaeon]|jgi:uracil-DNA glycosylase family 4